MDSPRLTSYKSRSERQDPKDRARRAASGMASLQWSWNDDGKDLPDERGFTFRTPSRLDPGPSCRHRRNALAGPRVGAPGAAPCNWRRARTRFHDWTVLSTVVRDSMAPIARCSTSFPEGSSPRCRTGRERLPVRPPRAGRWRERTSVVPGRHDSQTSTGSFPAATRPRPCRSSGADSPSDLRASDSASRWRTGAWCPRWRRTARCHAPRNGPPCARCRSPASSQTTSPYRASRSRRGPR